MKKTSLFALWAIIALWLTGCGNVTEEVWIDKKGNITLEVRTDMSEVYNMGEESNAFLFFLREFAKDPGEISQMISATGGDEDMEAAVKEMENLKMAETYPFSEGMKDEFLKEVGGEDRDKAEPFLEFMDFGGVRMVADKEEGILNYGLRFEKVPYAKFKDAGDALRRLIVEEGEEFGLSPEDFMLDYSKKKVSHGAIILFPMEEEDFDEMTGSFPSFGDDMSAGEDMNYTSIIHFPRKVKKVSNPAAKIGKDKKTVTISHNLKDVKAGSGTYQNVILLK